MKIRSNQDNLNKKIQKAIQLSIIAAFFGISGCETADVVPKKLENTNSKKQATLIKYESGATKIPKKSSGTSSKRTIKFKVTDGTTGLSKREVEIDIVRAPIDFSFGTDGNRSKQVLRSKAGGVVEIDVYGGEIPGPVELKATLVDNKSIFAFTNSVAVATGQPTQEGFSLAIEAGSANVLQVNDFTGKVKVITELVDRQGAPVSGVSVSFVSEGGQIEPNCTTNEKGSCNVEFKVQRPLPDDGRVSILTYVEGNKAYTDVDGDNKYTPGKDTLISNIGDTFLDKNEDNLYSVGEFLYEVKTRGSVCAPSNFYQPNIQGTCDNNLRGVLRRQTVFGLAYPIPTFVPIDNLSQNGRRVIDIYGNPFRTVPLLPGSTVSVKVVSGSSSGSSGSNSVSTGTQSGSGCTASLSGLKTIPKIMNLRPGMKYEGSPDVRYVVNYQNCNLGLGTNDDKIIIEVKSGGTTTPYALK